jgi:hypothetical protein
MAEQCIQLLKDRGCDYSLLFWMRTIDVFKSTEFGMDLLKAVSDAGVPPAKFADSRFRKEFFTVLRNRFNVDGLNPVNPNNFVVAMNAGGKEKTITAARLSKWPRPYQPFCFQTRTAEVGPSLFFVYQCWQVQTHSLKRIVLIIGTRRTLFG